VVGKLTERKLNEKLDQLAGNVSDEDSGSWDEEADTTQIKSGEEDYYDEEDYGTEDPSPKKVVIEIVEVKAEQTKPKKA
jgi:hypothetical protein